MILANILAFPIMLVMTSLQMVVFSRILINSGSGDLILLTLCVWAIGEQGETAFFWGLVGGLLIGFISATPLVVVLGSYILVVFSARLFHRWLWQAPILATMLSVVAGTIGKSIIEMIGLQATGIHLNFLEGLGSIIAPSLLLNFLLLFPMYILINDLAQWMAPKEIYEQ